MQWRQQQRSDAPAVTVGREIPREPPSNPGRRLPSPPQSLPPPAPRLPPPPAPTRGGGCRPRRSPYRPQPRASPPRRLPRVAHRFGAVVLRPRHPAQLSLGILGDDLRLVAGRTYCGLGLLVFHVIHLRP